MKKVLISAFTPFYKSTNNYSMEVIKYINIDFIDLQKQIIDVVYDECFTSLEKLNLERFDLIIALGEARSRKELTFESQALNLASCSIVDNKNALKQNEVIDISYPRIIKTKLDLSLIKEYGSISNDAGKFVCNNLYFHLLKNYSDKSLFIHIPECHNDTNLYKVYADTITKVIKKLLKLA